MISDNKNLLSLTGFKIQISGVDYRNTEYFVVSVSLPSISLSEIETNYRNNRGYLPGEKINYDAFSVRIAVDEELKVYEELYSWVRDNTKTDKLDVREISLLFLTSHNNVSRTMKFYNAFPTSIGQLEFNVQSTDVEYAYIDVTFRYDYFDLL